LEHRVRILSLSTTVGAFVFGLTVFPPPASCDDVAYVPRKLDAKVPRQPYDRYTTTDAHGRTIDWYLSEEPPDAKPLPLIVFVQGSSYVSQFVESDGRVIGQHGHLTLRDAVAGRARLVIVEKPGVQYLDAPSQPPTEFRKQHTLDRWVEAVHAAIEAARRLPTVDASRTLVVGHSEGGLVACRLAAIDPSITHVATLAGGGPTQLFDVIELARRGKFFQHVSSEPAARVAHVIESWRRIRREPDNADAVWFGHAYPRWATFLATSPMTELSRTNARIFIAQGTADDAVTVESFDALHAHLLSLGKDVKAGRIEGADHNFAHASPQPDQPDGWRAVLDEIVIWYFAPAH
jgi:dienelactone hydrolase